MIELNQLRCFVATADELHFGRAAKRLNMTQPPLSRQIQLLERVIGVKLLERTSRQVSLTQAGSIFLVEARRIVRLVETATLAARQVGKGDIGRVAIGFTAVSGYSFVPRLVRMAQESLPMVALELFEMVSSAQVEGLFSGELDFALLRPPIEHAGFDVLPILREPLVAALGRDDPLTERDRLTLQDFDGRPLVMYSRLGAGYFHALLMRLFEVANVQPLLVQHVTQIHSMLGLVHAGLGAAIVPASAREMNFGDVAFRPLDTEPAAPVELWGAWHRDNQNPALAGMLSLFQAVGAVSGGLAR